LTEHYPWVNSYNMESLLAYINGLGKEARHTFAERCGTSVGYLRKAVSAKQRINVETVIAIERESGRRVLCEQLRPDVDWAYLRTSKKKREQAA